MNLKTVFTLLIFIFHLPPATSCAKAITLGEAIKLAIDNDARLQAERLSADAVYADGWRSVGEYGPTLDVYGSYAGISESTHPGDESEAEREKVHFNEPQLKVAFEQPLLDPAKLSRLFKGVSEMDMGELLRRKATEDLLLRVYESYYRVLSSREGLVLSEAESSALNSQLNAAAEKLELGFGTITDQHNADARYQLALASQAQSRIALENDIKALEEIINMPLEDDLEDFYRDRDLPDLPDSAEQWLEVAEQRNTDLNLKKLQASIAHYEYRAVQSRFLPALSVYADYNERRPDDGLSGYKEERSEASVGLRLSMNLIAGGRDAAESIAASRRKNAAFQQVKVSLRGLKRSVYSMWDSLQGTRELVQTYKMASEANRRAMESTRASYEEGVKVLLDLLNAQQDYYRSLREYHTTRYDYLLLLQKFRIVVGGEEVFKT